MFERLTKLWSLLKKRITKPQKKVFAEKIKKHKAKISKIEKGKKAFLLKMSEDKKKKGKDFKIVKSSKDKFSKFKTALRKENLAMEQTSKQLTEIILQKDSKRVEALNKIGEAAKESAGKFTKLLLNLKEKRSGYKAEINKIKKDRKDFLRPIAKRKQKDGAAFVMSAFEKNKYTAFKRKEALLEKQVNTTENLMKVNLRERKRYTTLSDQVTGNVEKLEKGMKRFKMVAEAPIKYRESTEQLAKIIKERDTLIEQAISNSEKSGKLGLKFTEEEKSQISALKGKEAKLQSIQTRSQKIVALNQKIRARSKEKSSIQPTATPRIKPSSKKDRGIN